ncbi:MAG: hypothetical protein WC894_01670 [Patescibacteria group bacterium]
MLPRIFKNKYIVVFILIILFSFFVPFISVPFFYQYKYISSGDFLAPLSKNSIFFSNFFAYNPFFYGGNASWQVSKIFPESFLFIILGYLGLNPSTITLIYVSIIILLSELSMFYFLVYAMTSKLNIMSERKYFFAIVGSIIYTFSPHFIATVSPGHFVQLTVYALLPLLLVLFDKNLQSKKIKFEIFFKYFIIFLLCATAFGNIAFIYVVLLTFGVYSLLKILIEKTSIIKLLINLFILIFSIFTSNIFWIASFFSSSKILTNLSKETLDSLDNQVYLAVTKVNISTILFGRSSWSFYLLNLNYYINIFSLLIFILIATFFIISIIKAYKNKFILVAFSMSLFAIFISKGPREPFGNIFMWFYHNLIGFQVFRRPDSKYYGVFLLFFFTLSLIGIVLTTIKLSTKKFILFVITPVSLITLYIAIIFIKTFTLIPFNIPGYYFDAKDYLIKEKVNQMLILPGLYGLQPTYDESINNLYATDFLSYIWHFPFDTPVNTDFATNYQKKITNQIMNRIRKGADICNLTKEAGISHIMLRHDLSLSNRLEDNPEKLSKILNTNKLVVGRKNFYSKEGKGFTIYKIDGKCTGKMIQISKTNNVKVDYQIINPVKIKLSISGLKNLSTLLFLNNFQPTWKLYISKYDDNFFLKNENINLNTYPKKKVFFEGDELQFLTKKPLFEKSLKTNNKSWTNQWSIDPQYIKDNYSDSYYKKNSDGSLNLQLTIYFKTQNYIYLGLSLFGIVFLVFSVYFCFYIYKKVGDQSH